MKRGLLSLGLLAMSLVGSTGCVGLHHRNGWGKHNSCNTCNGPIGCRPCRIGWQRGGTDYGSHLTHSGSYCYDGSKNGGACGPGGCGPAGGLHGMGGGLHGMGGGLHGMGGGLHGMGAGLHGMGGGLHGAGNGGMSHAQYRADDQVGSGVPGPTVAYPYYTTRGPRDFLLDNPPSIGR